MSDRPFGPLPLPPGAGRSSVPLGLPFTIAGSELAGPLDGPGESSGRMLRVAQLRREALEAIAHAAEHGAPATVSPEQVDFIGKMAVPLWQQHLPAFCERTMSVGVDPAGWFDLGERLGNAAAFCYRQAQLHPVVNPGQSPEQSPPAQEDAPGGAQGG